MSLSTYYDLRLPKIPVKNQPFIPVFPRFCHAIDRPEAVGRYRDTLSRARNRLSAAR